MTNPMARNEYEICEENSKLKDVIYHHEREKKLLVAIFDAVRALDTHSAPEAIQAICEKLQKARMTYEDFQLTRGA